jgi:N utilization substance protein B
VSAPSRQPTARTKARKRALDLLFAAEARGLSAVEMLDQAIAAGESPGNTYTATLVRGVVAEQARIDELLSTYSQDWTLDRMPAVDRNVLRLGVWELLHATDVPEHVAISEAMQLVRDLSTDDSPQFVNGILGAIQRDKATLA